MQWLADGAWKELGVYIKSKGCLRVLGRCADSGHPVIFGLVDCCDGEMLVEQLRVAGHARHLGRRSLEIAFIYTLTTMREISGASVAWLSKARGGAKNSSSVQVLDYPGTGFRN